MLPECVPVYLMWQAVQTQWQWTTDGFGSRRVGLSYPGVRAAPAFARLRGRRQRETMLDDLCLMEAAWLNEDARQRRYRASKAQQPPVDALPG